MRCLATYLVITYLLLLLQGIYLGMHTCKGDSHVLYSDRDLTANNSREEAEAVIPDYRRRHAMESTGPV